MSCLPRLANMAHIQHTNDQGGEGVLVESNVAIGFRTFQSLSKAHHTRSSTSVYNCRVNELLTVPPLPHTCRRYRPVPRRANRAPVQAMGRETSCVTLAIAPSNRRGAKMRAPPTSVCIVVIPRPNATKPPRRCPQAESRRSLANTFFFPPSWPHYVM